MSEFQKSPSIEQSRRTLIRATIVAAVFLALHVLPLFWRPNPLWGVDFLFYLPAPVQALFVLLSVLLFVPGFRRGTCSCLNALPFALWGQGRRVWITRTLVLILALTAFLALHSARHFLGDGYHLLDKLEADTWIDMYRAPLTYALIQKLHHAGSALWQTAENSYRVYSYASGILYVLLCFPVAAILGKNALEKSVVLAFLFTAGYMQLFFGYVENYSLYLSVLLLYLFLGLRTCEQRLPLIVPAFSLGVLSVMHRAFLVFGPSLLYLAYRDYRGCQNGAPNKKRAVITAGGLLCFPAGAALSLYLSGVGLEAYLSERSTGEFLPVFSESGFYAQYRMFTLNHIVDFINQQILSAPTACMALLLLRKKDLRHQTFLGTCTVVPLFFTFVANPGIGAVRDWDILSLPALPFTLWTATMVVERIRDPGRLFQTAFILCGGATLHTCLWVGLNSSSGAAEGRFVQASDRLTGSASVNSWMAVGNIQRQEGRYADALYAYKRALESDPGNPNRWLIVGAVYRDMKLTADAIECYKRAQELQPNLPIPYMHLGTAYSDLGQVEKAITWTRKAIAIQPDNATAHVNLGVMYRRTGQVAKAIEVLERAAALRPDHADIYGNLGAMYREAGKYTRAIAALKKAVTIRPEDATYCLNLGVVYCDVGQFDNGIEYLGKALEINPGYVLAYVNIGNVYRRQGKYPLAIGYFEKALELQTGRSQFHILMAIGDTYYKMGEHEKAIPHLRKAVGLNPNDANAHLLLGLTYQELKRGDRAKVHFEKTLELEPEHPHAAQIKLWIKGVGEGRI